MNKSEKEKLADSSFKLISPFVKDPFIGNLATPITNSNFTVSYLSALPIYQKNLSPLLRGINIGFVHGYFLFGPFFSLGPLRHSEASAFIAFLSTTSLIIILSLALLIYGIVSFKNEKQNLNFSLFNSKNWQNFSSGFTIGGLSGVSFAYLLLKFFVFT